MNERYRVKGILNFIINKFNLNNEKNFKYFNKLTDPENNINIKNNKMYYFLFNVYNVKFYLKSIFIRNLKFFDWVENWILYHKFRLLFKSSILIMAIFMLNFFYFQYYKLKEFNNKIFWNEIKSGDLEKNLVIDKVLKNKEIKDNLIKNVCPLIYGSNLTLLTMNGVINVLNKDSIKNDTYKLVNKNLLINNILNNNKGIEDDLNNLTKKLMNNQSLKKEIISSLNNFLKSYKSESLLTSILKDVLEGEKINTMANNSLENLVSNYSKDSFFIASLNSHLINYLDN